VRRTPTRSARSHRCAEHTDSSVPLYSWRPSRTDQRPATESDAVSKLPERYQAEAAAATDRLANIGRPPGFDFGAIELHCCASNGEMAFGRVSVSGSASVEQLDAQDFWNWLDELEHTEHTRYRCPALALTELPAEDLWVAHRQAESHGDALCPWQQWSTGKSDWAEPNERYVVTQYRIYPKGAAAGTVFAIVSRRESDPATLRLELAAEFHQVKDQRA
jgi:hypothetical protein